MFCKSCGTKIIRGYSFCMECGTPVPQEEPDEIQQEAGVSAPEVKPAGGEGTLVFCPNCGTHMQQSTDMCEKCGTPLNTSSDNNGGSVPLWNPEPSGEPYINNTPSSSAEQVYPDYGKPEPETPVYAAPAAAAPKASAESLETLLNNFSAANEAAKSEVYTKQPESAEIKTVDEYDAPTETVAEDTAPTETIAEYDAPAETVDEDTAPAETVDEDAALTETVAEDTAPTETVAEDDAPTETVAEDTVPAETVAEDDAPTETVAEDTAPAETVAEDTAPAETVAEDAAPAETVAEDAAPAETVAEYDAPTETVAEDAALTETVAEYDAPTETVAEDAAPAETSEQTEPLQLNRPESGNKAAADTAEPVDPSLGKLVYCRNCGQDMYENETVCKFCGAPKRDAYKPHKHTEKKESFKLFGVLNIPTLVGIGCGVAVIVALVITSLNQGGKTELTGNETLNSTTSAATASTEPAEPAVTDAPAGESAVTEPVTTSEPIESNPVTTAEKDDISTSKPDSSSPETTSKPNEATSPAATTKPATSAAVTAGTSGTTSTSGTTKPVTTAKPAVSAPSATVKAQNKDRDNIFAAVEIMSGEVGKLDVFAQYVITAISEDDRSADAVRTSTYNTDFCKNLLSLIKSGKTSVDSAINAADPSDAAFDSAYTALNTLYKKYYAYYDYIVNSTGKASKMTSDSASYLDAYISTAKSSFKYTKLETSAQTQNDKLSAYASAMTDALTAAENAVSAYSTLQSKISALSKSGFEEKVVAELSKSAVIKTYANAAKYTQEVIEYCDILASAPAEYSTSYSKLTSARDSLTSLLSNVQDAKYSSPSTFKSETGTSISNVNNAIAAAKKALN